MSKEEPKANPRVIQATPEEPFRRTARRTFLQGTFGRMWEWLGIDKGKDWFSVVTPVSAVVATLMVGIFAAAINQNLQEETAMQTYLDQTTGLLLKDDGTQLRKLTPDDEAKDLLDSRTTLLLEQLSPYRTARLVRYLARANLLPVVSLAGADLRGLDFADQNLAESDLSDANLSGADLSRADLSRADLSGANLRNADLRNADLSGANLSGANGLTQEQVEQAIGNDTTILPEGIQVPGTWPLRSRR